LVVGYVVECDVYFVAVIFSLRIITCIIFTDGYDCIFLFSSLIPSSALTPLVGLQEGHPAQLMPLPLTVSNFSKIQIDFTFLVPAHHPDSPRKRAVKRVCVCIIAVYMTCSEMLVRHWSAFVAWTVVGDSFI